MAGSAILKAVVFAIIATATTVAGAGVVVHNATAARSLGAVAQIFASALTSPALVPFAEFREGFHIYRWQVHRAASLEKGDFCLRVSNFFSKKMQENLAKFRLGAFFNIEAVFLAKRPIPQYNPFDKLEKEELCKICAQF